MIKIIGNDIHRDGEKIGWIQGNHIYSQEGHSVGYFSGNDIYDAHGNKVGYLEGKHFNTGDGRKISVDETGRHVEGARSDLERMSVKLLLDDRYSG